MEVCTAGKTGCSQCPDGYSVHFRRNLNPAPHGIAAGNRAGNRIEGKVHIGGMIRFGGPAGRLDLFGADGRQRGTVRIHLVIRHPDYRSGRYTGQHGVRITDDRAFAQEGDCFHAVHGEQQLGIDKPQGGRESDFLQLRAVSQCAVADYFQGVGQDNLFQGVCGIQHIVEAFNPVRERDGSDILPAGRKCAAIDKNDRVSVDFRRDHHIPAGTVVFCDFRVFRTVLPFGLLRVRQDCTECGCRQHDYQQACNPFPHIFLLFPTNGKNPVCLHLFIFYNICRPVRNGGTV